MKPRPLGFEKLETRELLTVDPLFASSGPLPVLAGPLSVQIADVNKDNVQDLAIADIYANKISVLLGKKDGGFSPAASFPVGSYPTFAAVGDVNSDGNPDLAVSDCGDNTVSILLGDGKGSFGSPLKTAPVFKCPSSVQIADFNHDQIPDLLATNQDSTTFTTMTGEGDGTFGNTRNYAAGLAPRASNIADVNKDGNPDALIAISAGGGPGGVSVALGTIDGSFSPSVYYATGKGVESVQTADLNEDGLLDLITSNGSSSSMSILLATGNGAFSTPVTVPVVDAYGKIGTADYNGDGHQDVAIAGFGAGSIGVFFGDGKGGFTEQKRYNAGTNPYGLAAGDIDADGNIDLAVTDLKGNSVMVLTNLSPDTPLPVFEDTVGENLPSPFLLEGAIREAETIRKKSVLDAWDAEFSSTQFIPGGEDGSFSFHAGANNMHAIIGLGTVGGNDHPFSQFPYILNLHREGGIHVFDGRSGKNVNCGQVGTYAAQDLFTVRKQGQQIIFEQNGKTIYTFNNIDPSIPLYLDGALQTPNAALENLELSWDVQETEQDPPASSEEEENGEKTENEAVNEQTKMQEQITTLQQNITNAKGAERFTLTRELAALQNDLRSLEAEIALASPSGVDDLIRADVATFLQEGNDADDLNVTTSLDFSNIAPASVLKEAHKSSFVVPLDDDPSSRLTVSNWVGASGANQLTPGAGPASADILAAQGSALTLDFADTKQIVTAFAATVVMESVSGQTANAPTAITSPLPTDLEDDWQTTGSPKWNGSIYENPSQTAGLTFTHDFDVTRRATYTFSSINGSGFESSNMHGISLVLGAAPNESLNGLRINIGQGGSSYSRAGISLVLPGSNDPIIIPSPIVQFSGVVHVSADVDPGAGRITLSFRDANNTSPKTVSASFPPTVLQRSTLQYQLTNAGRDRYGRTTKMPGIANMTALRNPQAAVAPTATIRADFYNGATKIGSATPDAEGNISFVSPNDNADVPLGITGAILTPSHAGARMLLENIDITQHATLLQPSVPSLLPVHNADLAAKAALYDWNRFSGTSIMYWIQRSRDGNDPSWWGHGNGNFQRYPLSRLSSQRSIRIVNPDTNPEILKNTRQQAIGVSGYAFRTLPKDFYEEQGPYLVVAPFVPRDFQPIGYTYANPAVPGGYSYSVVMDKQAATYADVLPPSVLNPRISNAMYVNGNYAQESAGFGNPLADDEWARMKQETGGSAVVVVNILNQSTKSGEVTFTVHVGTTGTVADRTICTKKGIIGAGTSVSTACGVSLDKESEFITMATWANGKVISTDHATPGRTRSMDRAGAGTNAADAARMTRINNRIITTLATSNDSRITQNRDNASSILTANNVQIAKTGDPYAHVATVSDSNGMVTAIGAEEWEESLQAMALATIVKDKDLSRFQSDNGDLVTIRRETNGFFTIMVYPGGDLRTRPVGSSVDAPTLAAMTTGNTPTSASINSVIRDVFAAFAQSDRNAFLHTAADSLPEDVLDNLVTHNVPGATALAAAKEGLLVAGTLQTLANTDGIGGSTDLLAGPIPLSPEELAQMTPYDLDAAIAQLVNMALSKQEIYGQVINWYDPSVSSAGIDSLPSLTLPPQSATTRILQGIAQRMAALIRYRGAVSNEQWQAKLTETANFAAVVLGVPPQQIYAIGAQPNTEAALRNIPAHIVHILTSNGYMDMHKFLDGNVYDETGQYTDPAARISEIYTAAQIENGNVRLHFDLDEREAGTGGVVSIRAEAFTQSTIPSAVVMGNPGQLYVDFPADRLPAASKIGFEITVRYGDGKEVKSVRRLGRITDPEAAALADLSTLPEGDPRREAENGILTTLKNNFILENPSQWSVLLASTFHRDSAFNALDLNEANDDKAPISTPADGTVKYNKKDTSGNPTLVIEHKTMVNGNNYYWYTKYLHAYTDDTGLSGPFDANEQVQGIVVGTEVSAASVIAQVGGFGNNGNNYSVHLHFEVFANPNGIQLGEAEFFGTNGIDLRKLLTDPEQGLGIPVYAAAYDDNAGSSVATGPEALSVRWEDSVGAWVNDANKLILNRDQMQPGVDGNDSYWVAWSEEAEKRDRVVWQKEKEIGNVDGIFRWRKISEPAKYWNGNDWIDCQLLP